MSDSGLYYEYIIRMITQSTHDDVALLEMFSAEDSYSSKSFYNMISNYVNSAVSTNTKKVDKQRAYEIFIDVASDYILSYAASYAAKRRFYNRIYAFCESIGQQYEIENYKEYLQELPQQIATDITVELVKDLHNQDGISKADLAAQYVSSAKTFQVLLSKLGDRHCKEPLRIGGQAVYVPVSRKKSNQKGGKWRYYTKNTMSPLVFQMNIMQVETLLKSFQLNYREGNDIPLDLAIDTWAQLSPYVRERIREVFGKRDSQLSDFLDEVEEKMNSDTYRFMTESEIMESGNVSFHEKLEIAAKGGRLYNLSLLTEQHITRKNQRINYDHDKGSFYAVSADNEDEKLYFTADDINVISEA